MIDARTFTEALAGRWYGAYGTAPCPVCQPERRPDQAALTIADGHAGLLTHCKKSDCDFREVRAAAGVAPGDWRSCDPAGPSQRREQHAERMKREAQAQAIMRGSRPIEGTIAEIYLRGRGITCALPSSLRFHEACWHGPTATRYPAMLARVDGADGFGVHRTYLRPDGLGKADIKPAKAAIGTVSGGAVRIADAGDRLVVAEGIETAVSLACGLLPAPATIWAALSTSGMRALRLPNPPGDLTIAGDGDDAGRAAAIALAERADAMGWRVSLLTAPDGRDWNDILVMKGDAE